LLEALCFGLPCIGTTVGAIPDILAPDGGDPCGLLARPGNVSELAAALRRLHADAALRAGLAQAARRRGACFGMAARLDSIETLYTEMLRAEGRA
jgi:glycosyltransferase involved in cell wall biosynthesis